MLSTSVTFVSSLFPMSDTTSVAVTQQVEEMRDVVRAGFGVPYIFGNNLIISLISFTPFIGLGWTLTVAYNNGLAFTAMKIPYLIYLTPFFILEYLSNSVAIVEGARFVIGLYKSENRRKTLPSLLNNLLKKIGLVTVMLFLSAVVEMIG